MTTTDIEPIPVTIVDSITEKQYGADFGSWNTYPVTSGPVRILPRRANRERAVIWIASTLDANTTVLLASSSENAQAGVGGLMTAALLMTVESQQDVWAIKIGSGSDVSLSVHDETWRE